MNEVLLGQHTFEVKLLGSFLGLVFLSFSGVLGYSVRKGHSNTVRIAQNQVAILEIQKTCKKRLVCSEKIAEEVEKISRNIIRIGIHADVPDLDT